MMNQPFDRQRGNDMEDISGIFSSHGDLERIMNELEQRNLRDHVSVLMSDKTRDYYRQQYGESWPVGQGEHREHHTKVPEGATTGGIAGGLLGAIIGGLTLVGSVVIPGAGLLVAGPLVGALTGGAIGTAAGGLVGALVGAGIPEEEAVFYERSLKEQGNVLVVAHVSRDQEQEVRDIFQRCGARSIKVNR